MGAYESGQAFLAGVFAKLPEEQRAQVEAAFNDPKARDAVVVLGDGTLARSEFSRRMDEAAQREREAQALYDANEAWFRTHKPVIDEYQQIKPEYDRLKASGAGAGGTGHPLDPQRPQQPPAAPTFDQAAIQKLIQEQIGAAASDVVGIGAWTARRSVEHFQRFNEVLPVDKLVADTIAARQKNPTLTLDDTYNAQYGERLTALAQKAEDERINKLVQERLAAERASAGHLPFPVRTEASVLDTIGKAPEAGAYGVDAAVAEYTRLQAARSA